MFNINKEEKQRKNKNQNIEKKEKGLEHYTSKHKAY